MKFLVLRRVELGVVASEMAAVVAELWLDWLIALTAALTPAPTPTSSRP